MNEKIYDILITPAKINFAPQNSYEEILQNVITICSTIKGSRPMDRDFGVSSLIIDEPTPAITAKFNAEILAALKKYEPRAEVQKITWQFVNEKLTPKISIRIEN